MLGDDVRLPGGAAGDDLAMKRTVVGMSGQVHSDAILVAVIFSKAPIGVGVCHGHEPVTRPLKVTRARGNVVHEIENRPAWDVWRDETAAVAARSGLDPHRLAES